MNYDPTNVPRALLDRPHHRGLPIPWAQLLTDDGTPDYTTLDRERYAQAISDGRCWLCGRMLGHWKAYVTGMDQAAAVPPRTGLDPCMHPECARSAVQSLCPHIMFECIERRVPTSETVEPVGWVEHRPRQWALCIVRRYRVDRRRGVLLFPEPVDVEVYTYVAGRIVRVTE